MIGLTPLLYLAGILPTESNYAWIGATNGKATAPPFRWLSDSSQVDASLMVPDGGTHANSANWGLYLLGLGSTGKRISDSIGTQKFAVLCESLTKGQCFIFILVSDWC